MTFGSNTNNKLLAQGDDGSNPVTLTIGSGITIAGGSGILGGNYPNDSFINDGAITIPSGQTLQLGGGLNWVNNGVITANGATVNLNGVFTFAGLGDFSATGGLINLDGTLNNAGATLPLAPGIGAWRLQGGTINGGTITTTGGSVLALTDNGGTLAGGAIIAAGATLDATQNINGSQDYAYVTGGLTLNGTANLGAAGGSTYGVLHFESGSQTLAGSGTVTFGSNTNNKLLAQGDDGSNPVTLTIGSGITIAGGSGILAGNYPNDSFINDGAHHCPQRPDAATRRPELGQRRQHHGQRGNRQPERRLHVREPGQLQRHWRTDQPGRHAEQRRGDAGPGPGHRRLEAAGRDDQRRHDHYYGRFRAGVDRQRWHAGGRGDHRRRGDGGRHAEHQRQPGQRLRDGRPDPQRDGRPGSGRRRHLWAVLYFESGSQTLAGSGTVTFGSNTSNELSPRGTTAAIR